MNIEKNNSYPWWYFAILLVALFLSIFFWLFLLEKNSKNLELLSGFSYQKDYWNRNYLPREVGEIVPIDTTKIVNDSLGHRRLISNLVNIAVKNSENSIASFAHDLKRAYPEEKYKIIYIDSVINRLQIELPEAERESFKKDVKKEIEGYHLLVWDEFLFDYVKSFNDPQLSNLDANWYLKAINIDQAWNKTTGDRNTVIAVIDNGFNLDHPEISNKAVKQYNVIDRSTNVEPGDYNHGTHVASTIVGNANNGLGLLGICPDCSFMPIKIEDDNGYITNTYVIDAILYAVKNKADVVNLSLGLQIPRFINIPISDQKDYINSFAKDEEEFWDDLFSYANDRNVTCVLAAGNNNMLTGFDSFQRSENTIKVGAVDKNFLKAPFSNFGQATTIYAPGVSIFGAAANNSYEFLEGTSMAAPIVSGYIGLLKSENKHITNAEIKSHLLSSASNYGNIKVLNTNLIPITNL